MKRNLLLLYVWSLLTFAVMLIPATVNSQTVDTTASFEASVTGSTMLYASVMINDVNSNGITDVVFVLSEPEISTWDSYSAAVRFAGQYIDVRDGGAFANPVNNVPVAFNTRYHVWISVDVPNKTYTTWIKTDAMADPVLIYQGAAFRKADITSLNRWSALHNPQNEPDELTVELVKLVEENASNVNLAKLKIEEGVLKPVFDPSVTEYAVTVPIGTTSVSISAVPESPSSSISGTGILDVSSGSNTATVQVTAEGGSISKEYTINVTVETLASGVNYALSLAGGANGANSNVAIPPLNLNSLPVTVEMWFKPEAVQNSYATLWYSRGVNNAGFQYDRWVDQTKVKAVWNGAAEVPAATPVPGEWNHVALVVTANSKTFYVNGLPTQEAGNTFNLFPFDGITYLGWDNAVADRTLNGLIDEVRIWSGEKTAEELENNKYTSLNGDEAGLVGYWNFDDRAATATDWSGNGNHGSISSGTYVRTDFRSPMEYVQSNVSQKNGYVVAGASNQLVMNFEITTINSRDPLLLTFLDFSSTGTTTLADISNVRVYSSTEFNEENLVAQSEGTPAGENFQLALNYLLSPGKNNFYLTYDVGENAVKGNFLDLVLNNFTLTGATINSYSPTPSSLEGKLEVNPDMFVSYQQLPFDILTTEAATSIEGANFASFQQNAIMTYKGYQYVTYWDKGVNLCLARKEMPAGEWDVIVFSDYRISLSRVADNHYTISMGICENDGTIHLAFDHHNDPLHYKKSVPGLANNPEEIAWSQASFGTTQNFLISGEPVNNITYPRFLSKPNGGLIFEARIGWSGDGDSFLWEYSGETNTWSYIGEYLNGTSVGENAYINGIQYDPDGRMHVSWIWRGTPDPRTNHDVYYGYSDDDGRSWYNAAGVQIGAVNTNPMSLNTPGLKVWDVNNNRGLINQESQAVDSKGGIHILQTYMLDEEPDNSNFWASRVDKGYLRHIYQDEAGVWQNDVIARSGRNRSEIAVDKHDNLFVVTADNRIYFAAAANGWKTWTEFDVSRQGMSINEVLIDREALRHENVLSYVFAHRDNDGKIIVPYYLLENKRPGTGDGLNRTLFKDADLDFPIAEQLGQVNLSTEDVTVTGEQLGIRFSGTIETMYAEAYTLYLTTSGQTKVWINDELVLETGQHPSPTEVQTSLPLLPSHKYHIKIDGIYESLLVVTKLEWSSESQDRELIPLSALYGQLQGLPPYEPEPGLEPPVINSTGKEFRQTVSCYPNPYNTTFTLNAKGAFVYQVYNINGLLVENGAGTGNCEAGGGLKEGLYLVKTVHNKSQRTFKLIKNK